MTESIFNLIGQHESQAARGAASYEECTKVATHDSGTTYGMSRMDPQNGSPQKRPAVRPAAVPGGISNMAAYELALKAERAGAEGARAPKTRLKPGVPVQKRAELDAVEIARRRQMREMNGGAMAAAMGGASALDRARAAKANAAAKNTNSVREQSIINGLMKEQGLAAGMRPAARRPEFSGKPTQPLAAGQKNYVRDNQQEAIDAAQRRSEAAAQAKAKAQGKMLQIGTGRARPAGQIPKYLVERKIEMEVDKAMKEDAERERLGGPKQMPEAERVATLAELERQRDAATRELNLIPPTKHQLVQYQTQIKKLEARLAEIEKAIVLFSRKIVYIT